VNNSLRKATTCSGGADSAKLVKETTSANRTLTVRRWPPRARVCSPLAIERATSAGEEAREVGLDGGAAGELSLVGGELVGHVAHGVAEEVHLVAGAIGPAGAEVATGVGAGEVGEAGDGAGGPGREPAADHEGGEGQAGAGEEEQLLGGAQRGVDGAGGAAHDDGEVEGGDRSQRADHRLAVGGGELGGGGEVGGEAGGGDGDGSQEVGASQGCADGERAGGGADEHALFAVEDEQAVVAAVEAVAREVGEAGGERVAEGAEHVGPALAVAVDRLEVAQGRVVVVVGGREPGGAGGELLRRGENGGVFAGDGVDEGAVGGVDGDLGEGVGAGEGVLGEAEAGLVVGDAGLAEDLADAVGGVGGVGEAAQEQVADVVDDGDLEGALGLAEAAALDAGAEGRVDADRGEHEGEQHEGPAGAQGQAHGGGGGGAHGRGSAGGVGQASVVGPGAEHLSWGTGRGGRSRARRPRVTLTPSRASRCWVRPPRWPCWPATLLRRSRRRATQGVRNNLRPAPKCMPGSMSAPRRRLVWMRAP
jgi:hypothetical protein